MRFLVLILISGCATVDFTNDNSCGVSIGGDYDNRFAKSVLQMSDVEQAVFRAIDGASLTTDHKLMDSTQNCKNLNGFSIYTKKSNSYMLNNQLVSGHTECWVKIIVIATPMDGNWNHSALIHQLFHAMQKCQPKYPIDRGSDYHHANWRRDGIFDAIAFQERR